MQGPFYSKSLFRVMLRVDRIHKLPKRIQNPNLLPITRVTINMMKTRICRYKTYCPSPPSSSACRHIYLRHWPSPSCCLQAYPSNHPLYLDSPCVLAPAVACKPNSLPAHVQRRMRQPGTLELDGLPNVVVAHPHAFVQSCVLKEVGLLHQL